MAAGVLDTKRMLPASADAAPEIHAPRNRFEVRGINAGAVAAKMIKIKPLGNRADQQFIREAMRTHPLASWQGEIAIAAVPNCTYPIPASIISLFDPLPEPFFGGSANASSTEVSIPTHAGFMHRAHAVSPRRLGAFLDSAGVHRYMVAETWGVS